MTDLSFDESEPENMVQAGADLLAFNDSQMPNLEGYLLELEHLLAPDFSSFVRANLEYLDTMLRKTKLAKQDIFAVQTFKNLLSLKKVSDIKDWFEPPSHVYLRVAVQLYAPDLELTTECFSELMAGFYTPSTPTLLNASTKRPILSSCYLTEIEDNRGSIFSSLERTAEVLAHNAAEGIDISAIRSSELSDGTATGGLIPVVKLVNGVCRYIKNRRKATATIFCNVWHHDIEAFCSVGLQFGDQEERAYDIHVCLWTYNLFWERVHKKGKWTLFCPATVPHLLELTGSEFERAYQAAEADPSIPHKKVLDAADFHRNIICNALIKTGKPFIMNRDSCTMKSNHRHLGKVGSNLCVEVVQHLGKNDYPVCNLHSLSLRKFVKSGSVDFELLARMTRHCIRNLNRMIARGEQSDPIFQATDRRNLAVALGVSGFADLLYKLDLCFQDPHTNELNKKIFACIYFNALGESVIESERSGPCAIFANSPTSQGLLQFDLWREEFDSRGDSSLRSSHDDEPVEPSEWGQSGIQLANGEEILPSWEALKEAIKRFGLRNSLVTALMPTGYSAQIRRNTESVEPPMTNLYSRKTSSGSFTILNRYLIKDLKHLNLWNYETLTFLRLSGGSLRGLPEFILRHPESYPAFTELDRCRYLCKKYSTVWEISQRSLMILAAERSRYIDQSCSSNLYLEASVDKVIAAHLTAYYLGLKTYNYYLRTTPIENAKFTVAPEKKYTCTEELCTSCAT